jgi:hypothetical protein
MTIYTQTPQRVKNPNSLYRIRPLCGELVRAGVVGANGAWLRRWPTPQSGRPGLVVIIGGRS